MAREDHVVDVLAAGRLDVDVDIRELVAHRVQEALEREVVPQRIHVGDPEQIAHERSGGAPPAGHVDPHRPDVRDDVAHREEERCVPHLPDHRELEVEPIAKALVFGDPSVVDTCPAALGEDRVGAPTRGCGEVGEVHLFQPDVEAARLGDLERRIAEVGSLGEEQAHRLGRLQPSFGVPARDVVGRDRDELAYAFERVGEERVLGHEVADGVRGDRAHLRAIGQPEHRADLRVRVALHPMLGRDVEAVAAERLAERVERLRGRIGAAADGEPAHVRPWAGDRDEAGGVGADLGGGDRRVAALAQHVRVGDQPAEVGVAALVLRQQDERRVAASLPDRERGPEDRPDAFGLARRDEPGGAVEPVAVGERDRRHLRRGRERGEVLGHERPLLQREGGPDVEMGEPGSIEHLFDSRVLGRILSRGRFSPPSVRLDAT